MVIVSQDPYVDPSVAWQVQVCYVGSIQDREALAQGNMCRFVPHATIIMMADPDKLGVS